MNAIFDYVAVVVGAYGSMKLISAYVHLSLHQWKRHKRILLNFELSYLEEMEKRERQKKALAEKQRKNREEAARQHTQNLQNIKDQLSAFCEDDAARNDFIIRLKEKKNKTYDRVEQAYEDALVVMRTYSAS